MGPSSSGGRLLRRTARFSQMHPPDTARRIIRMGSDVLPMLALPSGLPSWPVAVSQRFWHRALERIIHNCMGPLEHPLDFEKPMHVSRGERLSQLSIFFLRALVSQLPDARWRGGQPQRLSCPRLHSISYESTVHSRIPDCQCCDVTPLTPFSR